MRIAMVLLPASESFEVAAVAVGRRSLRRKSLVEA